jgi:hypothetical protein
LTNNGNVTINSLTGSNPTTSVFENKSGSTLIFNGASMSNMTLVASECENTVIYNSNSAQDVNQGIHCNMILRGGGTKTISGTTITTNGNVIQEVTVPVTNIIVEATVNWQINGGLQLGVGFVNYGNIKLGPNEE